MKIWAMFLVLPLVGCASYGEYYSSVDAANTRQVEAQRAFAESEAIRYQALMRIAETGNDTAKVAATMALAFSGQQGSRVQMAVPSAPQNEALQWASILVPGITQGLSIYHNAKLGMRQSDNATALGLNTNYTFGQFASEIAKEPVVVNQPSPVIVNQPDPVIVYQPQPTIVNPVIVPVYP